jgi:DNA repair protein RadD
MTLRPYQQQAHDAAWDHVKKCVDPCLIEAATGAGKSHIIAALAETIHGHTGKRVLCLAPSAELVVQNREKFLATGAKASMFSASAGGKELRHPVVFGSPLTVKNRISRFCQRGRDGYAAVIVDEAHGITPTLKSIIATMQDANPMLRVIGTTATPYRMGTGYIFDIWPNNRVNGDYSAYNPFFKKLVSRITARKLINMGYLTPPKIGTIGADGYDTSEMQVNARGQFDKDDVDRAYHGQGRLTAEIVADVVNQAHQRKGVMFFAATVQHAGEVMQSLPPELSAIVTGETKKKDRDSILRQFKAREIKYLVNVSVLTTGFDAPHVDCIAILRKTESAGLWSQIMGRGLRLDDGKEDCLVLDYTSNIEDHFPDGDLFDPQIEAKIPDEKGKQVEAECPECGYDNKFSANPDAREFKLDAAGYCLDINGDWIMTEYGPMPGHLGRRCNGHELMRGKYVRCAYRWTSKECKQCAEPNDITARYCHSCKAEMVDPNKKLMAAFKELKGDPTNAQTDKVISMTMRDGISKAGNKTVRADFVTPYRSFSVWFMPESRGSRRQTWEAFLSATDYGKTPPQTVTYAKDDDSGFYRILGLNEEVDNEPEEPSVPGFWRSEVSGQLSA